VRAAEQLFFAEGVRAVGVERLLAESGVGRASFYRHFASKDDLIVRGCAAINTMVEIADPDSLAHRVAAALLAQAEPAEPAEQSQPAEPLESAESRAGAPTGLS